MNRQEQSVERLKSCIADLKRLASNKVKRGQHTGTSNNGGNHLTGGGAEPSSYYESNPNGHHSRAYEAHSRPQTSHGYESRAAMGAGGAREPRHNAHSQNPHGGSKLINQGI